MQEEIVKFFTSSTPAPVFLRFDGFARAFSGGSFSAMDLGFGNEKSQKNSSHSVVRPRPVFRFTMHSAPMKTVKTFGNLADAGFAHSLLESAGIPAFIADEQS